MWNTSGNTLRKKGECRCVKGHSEVGEASRTPVTLDAGYSRREGPSLAAREEIRTSLLGSSHSDLRDCNAEFDMAVIRRIEAAAIYLISSLSEFESSCKSGTSFEQGCCPRALAAASRTSELLSCNASRSLFTDSGSWSKASKEADNARASADLSFASCSAIFTPNENGPSRALEASLIPVSASWRGFRSFLFAPSSPCRIMPLEGEASPCKTSNRKPRPLGSPSFHSALGTANRTCSESSS